MQGVPSTPRSRGPATRAAIINALTGLAFDRRYDSIRIADLVDAAGIGRATFYDHFHNKEEVLLSAMGPILRALAGVASQSCTKSALSLMLSHVWEKRAAARNILTSRAQVRLQRKLASMILEGLAKDESRRGDLRLLASAVAAAQLAALLGWVTNGASCPPEGLSDVLIACGAIARSADELFASQPTQCQASHTNRQHTGFNNKSDAMMTPLTGSEIARPFLPAKDFALSKRFYETLGFTKVLDGEVAIYAIGQSSFVLQNYYQKDWASNFMMQLMVEDLDSWWAHITSLDLAASFGVPAPTPPALQPWGLRVAYLIDTSGVLWHVAERRSGDAAE